MEITSEFAFAAHQLDKSAAARKPLNFIQSIEVQAKFESHTQAMLAHNMHFAEPVGLCRAAALPTFRDGLIARNELFFDACPFK